MKKKFAGLVQIVHRRLGQARVLCDWWRSLHGRDTEFQYVPVVIAGQQSNKLIRVWTHPSSSVATALVPELKSDDEDEEVIGSRAPNDSVEVEGLKLFLFYYDDVVS